MPRLRKSVKRLLEKARDSATQAISTYNDPRSSFRSGNFTVLMMIAWTAIIHAYFEKKGVNYYYRKSNGRYEIIDGERKAWDLAECVKHVFDENDPIKVNVELFLRLRHRIEHRNLPAIDQELLGECQALVLNFEEWLLSKFGKEFSLIDTIFVPIQLTSARRVMVRTKFEENTIEFIKTYRDILQAEILNSQQFSFKAYLVPKIGNHRGSSDVAIEFVKYDEKNPQEMEKYDKAIIGIKEKMIPVANHELYKPSDVLKELAKFGFMLSMNWHTDMWKKYKVRPAKLSSNKAICKSEYCVYDSAHDDYLYTQAWIEFLMKELKSKRTHNNQSNPKLHLS